MIKTMNHYFMTDARAIYNSQWASMNIATIYARNRKNWQHVTICEYVFDWRLILLDCWLLLLGAHSIINWKKYSFFPFCKWFYLNEFCIREPSTKVDGRFFFFVVFCNCLFRHKNCAHNNIVMVITMWNKKKNAKPRYMNVITRHEQNENQMMFACNVNLNSGQVSWDMTYILEVFFKDILRLPANRQIYIGSFWFFLMKAFAWKFIHNTEVFYRFYYICITHAAPK